MNYVSHLESAWDGTRFPAGQVHTIHEGRPLWVRYDLSAISRDMSREDFAERGSSLWRYRELLPLPADIPPVTLGEGMSPILPCPRLGEKFGVENLWIKDESQLPTGSFKSRGMTLAISMAKHFGIRRVALPTNGNAGGAAAAYAARAGMEAFVFLPADTPHVNKLEASLYGAVTYEFEGLISDCGRIVQEGESTMNWFNLSTLREPYRIEGKKTMGLELAEQFGWKLPDVILYPTGGGTGLIGMWKAFQELAELGWLEDNRMPQMVAVQSSGCCPIARAFEAGEWCAAPVTDAATVASGIRVPAAIGDFMILDAVRESGGIAMSVPEERILDWMRLAIRQEGIAVCPETAACIGALEILREREIISSSDQVVIFNTGAVQKYLEAAEVRLPRLSPTKSIDWQEFATQHHA